MCSGRSLLVRSFNASFVAVVAIAIAGCVGNFAARPRADAGAGAGAVDAGPGGGPAPSGGSGGSGSAGGGSAGTDTRSAAATGGVAGGSADAGDSGNAGGTGDSGDGQPVFVAVGFRAYRARSVDLGLTWTDVKTEGTSGDNQWVIRGVGFGSGLFVAARGFPDGDVRTSPDGANWTNRPAPTNQWMGGVLHVAGRFVAAGGTGTSWLSPDGIAWTAKTAFAGLAVRTIVAGGGILLAAGNGQWWRSMDNGDTWTYDSAHSASNDIKIAYCGNTFMEVAANGLPDLSSCPGFTRCRGAVHAAGVYLRTNERRIERSLDGTGWTPVHTATDSLEDVEIGYVR
jgi:hypothetical protein